MAGEWTASLYGHSHPVIKTAIQKTMDKVGLDLGATIAQEHIHASAICLRFDLERIRFVNSGTEANLHALAAARTFTGKRKVVVFSEGYHRALLTFSGIEATQNATEREDLVIVAAYNDPESARLAIQEPEVSAVLVEGMQGDGGAIPATLEFLKAVETSAQEVRSLVRYFVRGSIHFLKRFRFLVFAYTFGR